MKADWMTLKVSDGTEMRVYVARSEAPKYDLFRSPSRRPCLIVLQEAFGVNAHIREVCHRFAEFGFHVASPELYHRTAGPGLEIPYSDFPAVKPHLEAMTDSNTAQDLKAVAGWFNSQATTDASRMGAIGYCMGGRAAFLSNLELNLKCAVSYYGGRIAPALLPRASEAHGAMLLVYAGKDAHIGADQQHAVADALKKNKKSYITVEFGDADHGFFCDARPAYHAPSALAALEMTKQFFITHL